METEPFGVGVILAALDPEFQLITKERRLTIVAGRNLVGITGVSDGASADRHGSQLSGYIAIIPFEQERGKRNRGVDLVSAGHVFFERIVKKTWPTDAMDATVSLSPLLFKRYNRYVSAQLGAMPIGTRARHLRGICRRDSGLL